MADDARFGSDRRTIDERVAAAARRALAEAAARRAAAPAAPAYPREIDGPKGPEPVRYGDWDVKGRASDF